MSEAATEDRELATSEAANSSRSRGLLAIGLFKLIESLFSVGVGLGALHLVHKDLGDEVMRFVTGALHQDPEGRLVRILMEKTDLVNAHELRKMSALALAYAVVKLVEGIGLMLEKAWAEYLTLCLTIAFLPWEILELARGVDWVRVSLLLINLAVLAYLVWFLRRKGRLTSVYPPPVPRS